MPRVAVSLSRRTCTGVSVVWLTLCLGAPALAQPPGHASNPAPKSGVSWSVTISPAHLIIGPIVEITGEMRVRRKVGVAIMLGGGKFTDRDNDNEFDVIEAGVSGRWYVLGDFDRGLQLGASAEFVKVSGDNINNSGVSAVGNGLLLSPFIGYKKVWRSGMTFEAQLGPALLALRAEGDDGSSAEDSEIKVNLNLNLGWSF